MATPLRTLLALIVAAGSGVACDRPAAEHARCAERTLTQRPNVRDVSSGPEGSIEFFLWVHRELPTARMATTLELREGSGFLKTASCTHPDADAALHELQSALARSCGIEIDVERTDASCEALVLRQSGLGYVLDEPPSRTSPRVEPASPTPTEARP